MDYPHEDLATAVATVLGMTSAPTNEEYMRHNERYTLTGPDYAIRLHFDGYRNLGKVVVHPDWPEHDHRSVVGAQNLDISVSYARGAEAIAKEIQRRFVPNYLEGLAKAKATIAQQVAFQTALEATIKRLGPLTGDVADFDRDGKPLTQFALRHLRSTEGYGDMRVNSGDSVTLQFHSIPPYLAEKLLKTVQEATGK